MTSAVKKEKDEDWMQKKWRPAMGWMYMIVCMFDFVIAPVLWSVVQAIYKGGVNVQWQPLTLQGAGLFHLAMGAVLGIAAWGRTQEKVAGAANNTPTPSATPIPSTAPTPLPAPAPVLSAPAPAVTAGFGGKAAPPPAPQPEL